MQGRIFCGSECTTVIVHAGESLKSNPRRYMQITRSQWVQLIPAIPLDEEGENRDD